mgnify:FL=1|jgi:hypothetical protein|tara:strand:+ start:163 stop:375 length:213 start_codon:yes stop_codon:yes gene_type:complete
MRQTLEVVPAYGRDYKSQKEVLADWNADKDFQIVSVQEYGRYINKQDADRTPDQNILVRYAKLQKVMALA